MIEKIASQNGRNDEELNIKLAEELCKSEDKEGIAEIVSGLNGKNKSIANDCIKVLYEIGERKPQLIADYCDDFINLLKSRNNRLVWGGMTALATFAELAPDKIYKNIDVVLAAFESGSVIAVDNAVTVLAKLCKADSVCKKALFPKLLAHLRTCRPKEVAQHAERASICVDKDNYADFSAALDEQKEYLSESQQKRINKLEKNLLKSF